MIISLLTNFATAIALMGTVPINLPLIRTAELQLSMSFSNLAVPAIGGMAAQIRFLQKQGVDLASAVASGGLLINVGNIVAQIMLLGVAIAALAHGDPRRTDRHPEARHPGAVRDRAADRGRASGSCSASRSCGTMVVPPTKAAATTLWEAMRSPRRVVLLLGGNAINAIMYARVYYVLHRRVRRVDQLLDAAVAQHHHLDAWRRSCRSPAGTPRCRRWACRARSPRSACPPTIAVAAVLADQLVTSFLPAVPGWWATNNLLHDDYLCRRWRA